MKTITKIVAQKGDKSKANIFLDNDFFGSLTIESIVQNGLKKGTIITEERLGQIVEQSQNQTAYAVALKLVSTRFKTQREVEEYLRSKGYGDNSILFVVSKLLQYHYIDDAQYAKNFVEMHRAVWGKQKLKNQLLQKGVRAKIIDEILQDEGFDQSQEIAKLALKKAKTKQLDKKTYAKLVNHLVSKGFEPSQVKKVLEQEEFKLVDDEQFFDGTSKTFDDQMQDDKKQIKLLADKYTKNKPNTPQTYVKLIRHLISKGFDYQDIKSVLKNGDDDGMWN